MQRDKYFDIYIKLLEDYTIVFSPFDAIDKYADDASIQLPDWFTSDFLSSADVEYIYQHAGERLISNMILKMYDTINKQLPTPHTENDVFDILIIQLGKILYNKYMFNWSKLYDAMFADYNPIQNYDSTEEITRSGDDKVSVNTDNKQTAKVSAFNTATMQDNQEISNSGLASNNYSKTDYNSKVKTTKYGNIGITSSQDMINQEIELRKHNFIEKIMIDIDNIWVSNLYFYKN